MTNKVRASTLDLANILGIVSVKSYGATGDGVTDDTTAINLALASGYSVLFPAGTYLVSPIVLAIGVNILGTGKDSVIKLKAASSSAVITCGGNNVVENLAINGNKSAQSGSGTHGIAISGSDTVLIANVFITDTLGSGVVISGAAGNISVSQTEVTEFTVSGITITGGQKISVVDSSIYTSDVAAFPGDGISLSPSTTTDSITGVNLAGNTISGNLGRGIVLAGYNSQNVSANSIVNNVVVSNSSTGIYLGATTKNTLVGNVSKSNGNDGFKLEGNATYNTLTANVADTNGAYGFREVTLGSTPDYNKFYGNMPRSNVTSDVETTVGANSTVV